MQSSGIIILLLVKFNRLNPLVQPRFACPKVHIFSYFSKTTYVVLLNGSDSVMRASNEY